MPLLGTGFNESQPADSDLARRGAAEFRDLKSRIKAFANVLFNRDTGDLKDNVVRSESLKDLNPDPSGQYTRVTINKKGQVLSGDNPEVSTTARLCRTSYFFTQGYDPDGGTIVKSASTDDNGNTVAAYSFVTPAGVDRLLVRVQAPGGGSSAAEGGGGGGGFCESVVEVTEGDTFLVWVGEAVEVGLGTPAQSAQSKFEFNGFKYLKSHGGHSATSAAGAAGGDAETAGIAGGFAITGGKGTTDAGGAAGCGFPASDGNANQGAGAQPASTNAAHGFVVVEYWST